MFDFGKAAAEVLKVGGRRSFAEGKQASKQTSLPGDGVALGINGYRMRINRIAKDSIAAKPNRRITQKLGKKEGGLSGVSRLVGSMMLVACDSAATGDTILGRKRCSSAYFVLKYMRHKR